MSDRSEIAISFDTTGSMKHCIQTVRNNLDDNIKRILREHPRTRIGILAHGDYCDERKTYVTKMVNFTSDVGPLCRFVNGVENTSGGDADECYELVLREIRTKMSWSGGSSKAYVLIGDSAPHAVDYHLNTQRIDWREEIRLLAAMGIRGYAVHCSGSSATSALYQTLAAATGGVYLQLSDLANISDALVAIFMHRHGVVHLQEYENEVRARPAGVNADMNAVFRVLRQHENL